MAKLFLREDILLENVNTSPKTKVTSAPENDSDNGMGAECSITNVEDTGINFLAGVIFCSYKHYVLLTQFDVELQMSYFSIKLFNLKLFPRLSVLRILYESKYSLACIYSEQAWLTQAW